MIPLHNILQMPLATHLIKNIHDSPTQHLDNAIFGTFVPIQMREEMRLDKIIFRILDITLSRFLIFF